MVFPLVISIREVNERNVQAGDTLMRAFGFRVLVMIWDICILSLT